jgi:hypothetical protein
MEIKRGCVYFFRHVGLSPVKIGYSENESPINRFNQFRTYAPYGSEILGFIIISDAKQLETDLHKKYSSKRLSGEWFDLTEDEVNKEIDFYTNVADIKDRNDFQIAWAKQIEDRKNKIVQEIKTDNFKQIKKTNIDLFFERYSKNKNISVTKEANYFNVSRRCIYDWIDKYKNSQYV